MPLQITSRSIRSGWRWANIRPGTAPQSLSDELHPFDAELVEEICDEPGVALERVIEVPAFARSAEADQVGRDTAGALQERDPVV